MQRKGSFGAGCQWGYYIDLDISTVHSLAGSQRTRSNYKQGNDRFVDVDDDEEDLNTAQTTLSLG